MYSKTASGPMDIFNLLRQKCINILEQKAERHLSFGLEDNIKTTQNIYL